MQSILQNDPAEIMGDVTEPEKLTERYLQIKTQFKTSSKRNKLLIDCQEIAAQIIEKVKDFESDLRMRQTCYIFKELIFNTGVPSNMLKGSAKESLEAGAVRIN